MKMKILIFWPWGMGLGSSHVADFAGAKQVAGAASAQGGMRRINAHVNAVMPAALAFGILAD